MAFQQIIDMMLNPVFGWLLDIPSLLAILILSAFLGLVSILIQKYATDQAKLKRLKADTKKYQKQIREAQKKGDTGRVMKIQNQMMPMQLDMMKQSFKPLLFTMIPFLVIFFWLSNHFAFYPIEPGQEFAVTANFEDGVSGNVYLNGSSGINILNPEQQIEQSTAGWRAVGEEGTHTLYLSVAGVIFERQVLITTERSYLPPEQKMSGVVKEFNVWNKKILPGGEGFQLFGWKPGWIFYYILSSIPISLGFRKLLNVA